MWMAFGSLEYSEMAEVLLLLPASNIYFDRGAGYFILECDMPGKIGLLGQNLLALR